MISRHITSHSSEWCLLVKNQLAGSWITRIQMIQGFEVHWNTKTIPRSQPPQPHTSAPKSQQKTQVYAKKNMLVFHDQGTAISINVRRYTGRAMAAKENIGSKKRSKRFLNDRGMWNSVDFRFLWFSHLSSSNCFEPRNMDFQVVSRCLGSHFELRKCEWVTSLPSCPECLVPFLPMKFSPRAKLSQNEPGPRFRTSVWSYVATLSTSESPAIPEDTPSSAETAKHSAPPTPAECHSEKVKKRAPSKEWSDLQPNQERLGNKNQKIRKFAHKNDQGVNWQNGGDSRAESP